MNLPTTLEECHTLIRQLIEDNAALRKSGEDFGHLAERLNLALQESRRDRLTSLGPAAGARARMSRHEGPGPRTFGWSAWEPARPAGRHHSVTDRPIGFRECAAPLATKL